MVLLALVGLVGCGSRTGLLLPEIEDAAVPIEAATLSCTPATCDGCCDDGGACQPGTALEACGIGGGACQACNPRHDVCNPTGGGIQVEGVVCWAPCDVKACETGCCTPGGMCLLGNTDEACGQGSVCQDCAALGKSCGTSDGERTCL